MKKRSILAFVISLLLIAAVNAQTVSHSAGEITAGSFQSGNYIFPGNVGIGDTTPTEGKLVVEGSIISVADGTSAVPAELGASDNFVFRDTGDSYLRLRTAMGGSTYANFAANAIYAANAGYINGGLYARGGIITDDESEDLQIYSSSGYDLVLQPTAGKVDRKSVV